MGHPGFPGPWLDEFTNRSSYRLQFSICSGIILIATFVPKGSFALNPKAIEGVRNEQELWEDDSSEGSIKSDIERARCKTEDSGLAPPS